VPALPSCLIDPLWAELEALLETRPEFSPTHPWGCHRRWIPTGWCSSTSSRPWCTARVMSASPPGMLDRTIRRRVTEWAHRGLGQAPPDHPGRLRQDHRAGTGRPGDRRLHHESPMRRGQSRSVPSRPPQRRTETLGVPPTRAECLTGIASAGANRHDSPCSHRQSTPRNNKCGFCGVGRVRCCGSVFVPDPAIPAATTRWFRCAAAYPTRRGGVGDGIVRRRVRG
jgi:hypothetical protein